MNLDHLNILKGHDKPSILAFMPGRWYWPGVCGCTRYHLWSLAERGWPVLSVEPPNSIRVTTEIWSAPDRPFCVLKLGSIPPFAVSKTIPGFAKLHRSISSSSIWKSAYHFWKKVDPKDGFVWLGAPWHGKVAKYARGEGFKTVHHVYDELASSDYLSGFQKSSLKSWEKELLNYSDLVTCSSLPQFEKRNSMHPYVSLIENAVSMEFFDLSQKEPKDYSPFPVLKKLLSQPKPRFVYGGVLDHRCEGNFFETIANDERCGSLTFLGNSGVNIEPKLKSLVRNHPKVLCTGRLEHDEYAALYSASDVLLLGHQINDFTKGMFPAKLPEYLCSGKPIISVPMSEVVRINEASSTKNAIYFASNHEEIKNAISHALEETGSIFSLMRKQIAKENTWQIRAEVLEGKLLELIKQ